MIVRKNIIIALLSVIICQAAVAQVSMQLYSNRKNYHQYEPVKLMLVLRNFSGTPLIFGSSSELSGKITLEIKSPGSYNLPDYVQVELQNVILKPGLPEKVKIDLGKYFTIDKIGKYRIKALIEHKQLPNKYESNYVFFDSTKGYLIWTSTAGIPDVLQENKDRAVRSVTYKIDSLFDGRDKVYYLVIEDDKRIYTVSRIGYDVGTTVPSCKIDFLSQLHILIQESAKIFSYYVFDTAGNKLKHNIYKKKNKIPPALSVDPNTGEILVVGGALAKRGEDFDFESN